MTDTELLDAVVSALTAYTTAEPLASMPVHAEDQLGDETSAGTVTVILGKCDTHAAAVNTFREDAVPLTIRGVLTYAEAASSRRTAALLAQQITEVLLDNQHIAVLDDATDVATCCNRDPITRDYGFCGEADEQRRAVEVDVTYYKTPG